jgi:lantibiotic biosynthesis protein
MTTSMTPEAPITPETTARAAMGAAPLRERAAGIVEAVADRLTDPVRVVSVTDAPENAMHLPSGSATPWRSVVLSDGYPAVALLFAELGATDPARRPAFHGHLTAALSCPAPQQVPQLFIGAVSLAFAAHTAARGFGGYPTLLPKLDVSIAPQIRSRAHLDRDRISAGEPIGAFDGYDVITGASGVGRYLLARLEPGTAGATEEVETALREVLATLVAVALADDVEVDGLRVPAWWVRHSVVAEPSEPSGSSGHLNLGLAHGVCGPLALLALAWRAGVRVDRQDEAMARIVALLTAHRFTDDAGPGWPMALGTSALRHGDQGGRHREVWCYGAAGVGRSLYLAGSVLEEKGWQAEAHAALEAVLKVTGAAGLHDASLCHGWAGLLQIYWRMFRDTGEPRYAAAVDLLAGKVVDAFDPQTPFGYRYTHPSLDIGMERPGFLEGAAGIALALNSYATGTLPATNWDAALLLN